MVASRRCLVAAAVAACWAGGAQAQAVDAIVAKLQATHTLTIGYRETILPTSYLDEAKRPAGYAVEFCQALAAAVKDELKLPELAINYVPVTLQTRQALVANGTVDIECGGTVNTFSRGRQVDFTPVTYVASSQMLALRTSGINGFADLAGKIVAVATNGSGEPEIKEIIAQQKLANVRVLPVDDHAAGLMAVESRRADAYYSDNSSFFALLKQSRRPDALAIVGPEYGYSPQGFMIPKNNPTFSWIVARQMARMFKSGEAEALFTKWFGPFGMTVGPRLRAAWATASLPE